MKTIALAIALCSFLTAPLYAEEVLPETPAAPAAQEVPAAAPTEAVAPVQAAVPVDAAVPAETTAAPATPAVPVDPEHQELIKELEEGWNAAKNDSVAEGKSAFKRGQAQLVELQARAGELRAKLDEAIASVDPLRTEMASRSAELVKKAEEKKNPHFVATLEQELATRDASIKATHQLMMKDREDLDGITKSMTDWQAKDAEMAALAAGLEAEVDKGLAEVKANAQALPSEEWRDTMQETLEEVSSRCLDYKQRSDAMADSVGDWTERFEEMNSRLISLKENEGEWRLLMERRAKDAAELL